MERNKDYWNKGLPYLDGIEFYNLIPFSTELGSAILSGRVDYGRIVDPVTARKAKATPGMSTTAVQPERHPGDLGQQQEESRSTIRGCAAPCIWRSTGRR